jgi:hypothetical protein
MLRSTHALPALLVASLGLAACGGGSKATMDAQSTTPGGDPGPVHVHGLGVDPKDGSLYIATHTGLFRSPKGGGSASRIGDSEQDVMGFSIPGRDRFLGSGHPDPRESGQPPNLGLIESKDRGRTWEPISLVGQADFHVLRSSGDRIYGFNASGAQLMVSSDGGKTWSERRPPGLLIDLAIDPRDTDHVVASSDRALFTSSDQARNWQQQRVAPGFLAWPTRSVLYRIDGGGNVSRSRDAGRNWQEGIGSIGVQPAAFIASGRALYAALPDGTIKVSNDGGATWATRSTP